MNDAAETSGSAEETSTLSMIAGGAAFLAAATVVWVLLTIATDRTYHLAPVIIAVAPGVIARVSERRIGWSLAAIPGLVATAIGWAVIVAADAEPSATLAEGQPGGVEGEVVVGALVGAAASILIGRSYRAGTTAPPQG